MCRQAFLFRDSFSYKVIANAIRLLLQHRFRLGSIMDHRHIVTINLSEGRFGNRKCTLIGTWAGTQGGLSRDSKRVNPGVLYGLRGQNSGQNSEQNYAGMKRVWG